MLTPKALGTRTKLAMGTVSTTKSAPYDRLVWLCQHMHSIVPNKILTPSGGSLGVKAVDVPTQVWQTP